MYNSMESLPVCHYIAKAALQVLYSHFLFLRLKGMKRDCCLSPCISTLYPLPYKKKTQSNASI